jgi:hypothetical protein
VNQTSVGIMTLGGDGEERKKFAVAVPVVDRNRQSPDPSGKTSIPNFLHISPNIVLA